MDTILKNTPFNSYSDLFNAVKSGKANIKMLRTDCSEIARIKHPYFSTLGIFIGFLVTLISLIFFAIILNNYWLLLLIPVNFILSFFINYMPKLQYLSLVFLFLALFIFQFPNFVWITFIDIITMNFFYNIWWNRGDFVFVLFSFFKFLVYS